ncbi:MAG: hypothetical protein HN736_11255 [Anaerolineae bacterium]|jgi:hypothetical protein|nr:hypothetical protein [Anaerolineae bacterium]MBT3714010.1 hypothetical protein [Anaerolineae bacterium]MBT4311052.1 hypothetical protein [Anaerolineae bacterium]MBT4459892.1 hypothetical protein [Anaerolineae bacterium]MBT4841787.1 hypothetical protein [Anaerolineae bacterium]
MNKDFSLYKKRFIITFFAALLFVGIINEGAHILLKEKTDRLPEIVEISIPAGTAERIESGEADPTIPSELIFVIGDTLQVTNQDDVPHELGPLWIPAGSSASLLMENANKYTLGCTFQPSRYLDFDVRSRTTATSRLQAFGLATPPTAMFFFLYSLLVFPLKGKREKENPADLLKMSE